MYRREGDVSSADTKNEFATSWRPVNLRRTYCLLWHFLIPERNGRFRPGPGVAGPAAMYEFTPYPVASLSANQRIGGFRCALFFRRCSSSRSTDWLGWRTSVSPNTIKISPCCPSGLSVGGVWKPSFNCLQSLPDERIVSPNSDEFWIGLFLPWLTYVYHA